MWAYDYDPASGDAVNERVFLDFGDLPGRPDGACVDQDGCYWIACVDGWAVIRVTPDGAIDRRIEPAGREADHARLRRPRDWRRCS